MSGDWNDRKDGRRKPMELTPSEGRIPPSDLEAEGAVLSAVLLSEDAFADASEVLRAEHFYADANRRVYEAVVDLQESGRPVDVVTVAGWLRDRERLGQVGGTPYLALLTDATPAVAHVGDHARTVREKWRLRQLIGMCQTFAAEGYALADDVQGFIDEAEQAVFDIARVPEGSSTVPVKEAIKMAFKKLTEAAKRGEGITGVPTGFDDLDAKCAGLHEGDLYIIAGRPGMGKTAFVLNLAANVAMPVTRNGEDGPTEEAGAGVAFFSLEMPKEQLASRMLACEARVDVSKIRSGQIGQDEWHKLTDAAGRLGRLPLWIDDTPAISLLDLRAKVRRLKAEADRKTGDGPESGGLALVVIDYLQLMQGRKGAQSREQEISEMSRGLKQLAKEMGVAVIALSQLNRSVETRNAKDKRPQLSDLRESGAIEQDADTIMFVYRDEYYFEESPDRGIAEIIIAKQRNGPTGKIRTRYTAEFTRFDNLARDEYPFDDELDDFEMP